VTWHVECQAVAETVETEVQATLSEDEMKAAMFEKIMQICDQQRMIHLQRLVWNWKTQQKKEQAVAQAVKDAVKTTLNESKIEYERQISKLREKLRESQESIRKLEIIVRDDRQFFQQIAEAEVRKSLQPGTYLNNNLNPGRLP